MIVRNQAITKVNGITVDKTLMQSVNCNVMNYREVDYIVVHYTGNSKDTALSNARYFVSKRTSSAHFFVDETSIYQSVEMKNKAWHCGTSTNVYYHPGCRNANSIGIEMCCSGSFTVSEKTKENTAQLIAELCKMLGIGSDKVKDKVVRHWDVTHKQCPMQMAGYYNDEWTKFQNRIRQILDGEDNEVVEESVVIVNDKEIKVERILKNGTNYVKIRDIANALGLQIGNKGSIPVLKTK